jgi:multicomponent Na+:H+ antiporter subunit E
VRRRLVMVVVLTTVWVALWGDLTVANVIGGMAVAIGCLVVMPVAAPSGRGRLRPLAAASYLGYFAKELLVANVIVAVEVVTPGNRDNEGIVAMPVAPSCSPTVSMIVASSIGLTPGTVVVDVGEEPPTLYVHVLHLDDHDAAVRALLELQRRAIAAFGSDPALREASELERAAGVRP